MKYRNYGRQLTNSTDVTVYQSTEFHTAIFEQCLKSKLKIVHLIIVMRKYEPILEISDYEAEILNLQAYRIVSNVL
jgi:hypothetical protein